LSSGAAFDVDQGARDDMLVFGYSSLTEAQIGDAVGRLKSMLSRYA
jgi:GntR family transcriptional regulator/MocR family aminotransferase